MSEVRSGNRLLGITPGLDLVATDPDEVTTSQVASQDLKTLSGLNIAAGTPLLLLFVARKTAGAAASASLGFRYNATTVRSNIVLFSSTNQAEEGIFQAWFPPRVAGFGSGYLQGNRLATVVNAGFSQPAPADALNSLVITGLVADAAITLAVAQVQLYALR